MVFQLSTQPLSTCVTAAPLSPALVIDASLLLCACNCNPARPNVIGCRNGLSSTSVRRRAGLARGRGDLPLPKPVGGAKLAAKLPESATVGLSGKLADAPG